jgi:predicted acylesterase/phospholipase RssA
MRTALIISGGGAKGAFAVGALEVLLERSWNFDVICGTSTGALIAPLAAIGDIDELVRIYTTVRTKDILRLNWRRLFHDSIYDTKPLERLIRRTMKGERYDRLMASPVQVLLCSVGFQTGRIIYATQREDLSVPGIVVWDGFEEYVRATLASTNEPMLMPPVRFAAESCFDGGVREIAPLRAAQALGCTRAVVLANSPHDPSFSPCMYHRMVEIGPRALDLMTMEILNGDLECGGMDLTIIRPLMTLPSSSLSFVPEEMEKSRQIGQHRARMVLDHPPSERPTAPGAPW